MIDQPRLLPTGVCIAVLALGVMPAGGQPPAAKPAAPAPAIEVWYGERQRFGHTGLAQPLVNVLGSIKPSSAVADVRWRLNGGRSNQLPLGSDLHRLAADGDFNIEIDRGSLRPGENRLLITARTLKGRELRSEVVLVNELKKNAALPFEADFSKAKSVQDFCEVTDGRWVLTGDGVRTAEPYYDRQLIFGDAGWRDFEVAAELIIHDPFPDADGRSVTGPPYLSHSHASFNLRWGGHPDDGFSPRRDWMNLGALAALRFDRSAPARGGYWWLHYGKGVKGRPAKRAEMNPADRLAVKPGQRLRYRLRAETLKGGDTRYSTKAWPAGGEEPADWQFSGVDASETLPTGSVVFVTHHVDVTLCHVKVTALTPEPGED